MLIGEQFKDNSPDSQTIKNTVNKINQSFKNLKGTIYNLKIITNIVNEKNFNNITNNVVASNNNPISYIPFTKTIFEKTKELKEEFKALKEELKDFPQKEFIKTNHDIFLTLKSNVATNNNANNLVKIFVEKACYEIDPQISLVEEACYKIKIDPQISLVEEACYKIKIDPQIILNENVDRSQNLAERIYLNNLKGIEVTEQSFLSAFQFYTKNHPTIKNIIKRSNYQIKTQLSPLRKKELITDLKLFELALSFRQATMLFGYFPIFGIISAAIKVPFILLVSLALFLNTINRTLQIITFQHTTRNLIGKKHKKSLSIWLTTNIFRATFEALGIGWFFLPVDFNWKFEIARLKKKINKMQQNQPLLSEKV